ncbi:hypothetical protein J4Q44_G00219470, partial [Coregonus suidteri]
TAQRGVGLELSFTSNQPVGASSSSPDSQGSRQQDYRAEQRELIFLSWSLPNCPGTRERENKDEREREDRIIWMISPPTVFLDGYNSRTRRSEKGFRLILNRPFWRDLSLPCGRVAQAGYLLGI